MLIFSGNQTGAFAQLHTYRFCDNVWTFILQDALVKYDEIQENGGRLHYRHEQFSKTGY
ncbi:transcription initiation factor IIA, gamma subunit [Artemisia annua]|uniref:Transcription initiation factor IIA, gamma subunit n=1 Tax=Artemisia annua TaxID=35608 RepID=A0A2U1KX18_ARTAN|nr:transcription initiation factor IIA, gamma subunit [Artemisia annua]